MKIWRFQFCVLILQEIYKIHVKMLLNIEITNFFSVKEKVSIDFRAANIHTQRAKELGDNVIDWNGIKVLKSINASSG